MAFPPNVRSSSPFGNGRSSYSQSGFPLRVGSNVRGRLVLNITDNRPFSMAHLRA